MPLAGLVDVAAERQRLGKTIDKLRKDLARTEAKLANGSFLAKAPPAVVAKEQAKGEALRQRTGVLLAERKRLEAL